MDVKEILGNLKFDMTIAATAAEGYDLLTNREFDIIVTEFDLDDSDGIKFLQFAASLNSFSTRLIVGSSANEEVIVKAIIKGIACAYIDSASNRKLIAAKLGDMARIHTSMDNKRLKEIHSGSNSFPIVMNIYEQLMNAINNDLPIGKIAQIVSHDVTLTSKILHVANSAFYGSFAGTSVEKAIMFMGLNTVKDIVLMHSLSANLNMTSEQNQYFEVTVRHSVDTNYYLHSISHIYRECQLSTLNNSVGIIHDIGKIIQLVFFPLEFRSIAEFREENPSTDYFTSEHESGNISVNHAEVGAYFLKMWNFNQYAVESALFHHSPELASDNTKACIEALFLANTIADIRDGYDLSIEEAVQRCTIIKADPNVLMSIEPPRH
jgi:HD-like signal output (HDOD) protein